MLTNKEIEARLAVLRKEYILATPTQKEIIKRQARCLQIIQEKRKFGGIHSKLKM